MLLEGVQGDLLETTLFHCYSNRYYKEKFLFLPLNCHCCLVLAFLLRYNAIFRSVFILFNGADVHLQFSTHHIYIVRGIQENDTSCPDLPHMY